MDIAAMSMTLAQTQLGSKVGIAVLDKAMESNKSLADNLVQMIDTAAMERSVNPAVGGNFDIRV